MIIDKIINYDIIIFCKDSISNMNKENIHYKKAYKT